MFLQMRKALMPLRGIDTRLDHIKLGKKKTEDFLKRLKVLQNHTQSTEFMIQFFKESLVNNCDYKAWTDALFKPVRVTRSVYDKVKEFPMPISIPKPKRVGE